MALYHRWKIVQKETDVSSVSRCRKHQQQNPRSQEDHQFHMAQGITRLENTTHQEARMRTSTNFFRINGVQKEIELAIQDLDAYRAPSSAVIPSVEEGCTAEQTNILGWDTRSG